MYLKFCVWLLLLSLVLTGCKSTESSMSDITSSELENLFFREDWREIPPQVPVTQEHVHNLDLVLGRHGPAGEKLKKSNHDNIPNDPWYVWSGLCDDLWAISLRKKGSLVDMTGGRIHCRTRQAGPNVMKFIVELEDAHYFMDGWGIIEGDLIQLKGQTARRKITNVDYDNNTLSIDRFLIWKKGQGVSLAYHSVAPDIGAYEFGDERLVIGPTWRAYPKRDFSELEIIPNNRSEHIGALIE